MFKNSNITRLKAIDGKMHKITTGWLYGTIIVSLVLFASIFQMVQFGMGNGPFQDMTPWVGWMALISMTIANPMAIIAALWMSLKRKSYFFPFIISSFFFLIYFTMIGLWYQFIRVIVASVLVLQQFLSWDKKGKGTEIKSLDGSVTLMLISGIVLTSLGLGFLMSLFAETSILYNPNPYLDAFALLAVIAGFVLITNNYKQGFLMFYLANIVLIILFIVLAQWASMIMILIFALTTDPVGVLHWNIKYAEQNNK